ncbi:Pif1p [Brachionus plicatilis]|uniref:Pif1p n=1 Tax=Brachionus plicatilis TaxID=10195 RepID=A0A3M7P6K1_BRAPC|nr:Pif1p [Brachionus plicatilis]
MTIHKSQGQTLKKATIDLGKSERSLGLTFVALSLLKNINDFLFVPFPYDRLTKIKESKQKN